MEPPELGGERQEVPPLSRWLDKWSPLNLSRDNLSREIGRIMHYEYMALAKKTSVLREATLLSFEPRRFGGAEYADIFEAMLTTELFSSRTAIRKVL